MEMLRERIKALEAKIVELIRHGQDNLGITERLHRFTRRVLATRDAQALPAQVVEAIEQALQVPQVALRLWGDGVAPDDAVSDDVRSFTASLGGPYCGANTGFEAAQWLDDPDGVASLALVPLRESEGSAPFGLLVLGSPDASRYTAEMGTEFLVQLGQTVSAALTRLHAA